MAIVSRNGIWVMKIVKIRAGSSGTRRRHFSALDMVLGGFFLPRLWAVVGGASAGACTLMLPPGAAGWVRVVPEPARGGRTSPPAPRRYLGYCWYFLVTSCSAS